MKSLCISYSLVASAGFPNSLESPIARRRTRIDCLDPCYEVASQKEARCVMQPCYSSTGTVAQELRCVPLDHCSCAGARRCSLSGYCMGPAGACVPKATTTPIPADILSNFYCCNARFTRTVLGTSHPVASVSKCLQFCASNPLCIAMAWNPSGSPACFIALGKTGPVMFPGASGTNGQKVCVKRTVQVMDTPVGADAVIARCGLDSRNLNNSASGSFGMEPTMRMVSTIEACSTSEARCFTDGIVLCASQTAVPAKTLDSFNCSRSGGTTASATPAPAVTTAPVNQQPQSTGERTPFTDGFTSDVDNFFKSLDMSIVLMVTIPIGVVVLSCCCWYCCIRSCLAKPRSKRKKQSAPIAWAASDDPEFIGYTAVHMIKHTFWSLAAYTRSNAPATQPEVEHRVVKLQSPTATAARARACSPAAHLPSSPVSDTGQYLPQSPAMSLTSSHASVPSRATVCHASMKGDEEAPSPPAAPGPQPQPSPPLMLVSGSVAPIPGRFPSALPGSCG